MAKKNSISMAGSLFAGALVAMCMVLGLFPIIGKSALLYGILIILIYIARTLEVKL